MDLLTHPAFSNADQEFLVYLQKTLSSLTYKSDIEVIATLMAISNEANKKILNLHQKCNLYFWNILKTAYLLINVINLKQ